MGALPESQLKQFVDRLGGQGGMAEEIEAAVAEARLMMEQGDLQTAAQIFASVLQADREHAGALAAWRAARSPRAISRECQGHAGAGAAGQGLGPRGAERRGGPRPRTESGGSFGGCEAAGGDREEPRRFPGTLDLAVVLNGAGERAEATEQLLYVIRKKRDWNEEAARKQLVKFFEAWGRRTNSRLPAAASCPRSCSPEATRMAFLDRYTGPPRPAAAPADLSAVGRAVVAAGRLPLNIFEPRYLEMMNDAMAGDRLIGMIQPDPLSAGDDRPKLLKVGCAGRITAYAETPGQPAARDPHRRVALHHPRGA